MIYLDIKDSITLNLIDTTFNDITGTLAGGLAYINTNMAGALDFEVTNC